jgi:radical SAM superfamily enzyme YgiQ (UPF0313 family)
MRGRGDIVLVSCYEPGHQPVALASPAASLRRAGFYPACLDLAVEELDERARALLGAARLVAISAPMHTALSLGVRLAARVRRENPGARVWFYGLYAVLNERLLRRGGDGASGAPPLADGVLGPDCEEALVALATGAAPAEAAAIRTPRLALLTPDRSGLPALDRYARLAVRGGERLAGYVEATRGCKHLCRHCPVVPVYRGRFTAVPAEVVLADAAAQIAAGARHIDFGDPDFLNGPTHAMRIARALAERHRGVTFSFTAKVEHILAERALFPELAALGCVFVVSAVESLSDRVLGLLDKGHRAADVPEALAVVRGAGISLRPTFVPFTPWTSLEDYLGVCRFIRDRALEREVDPVQLSIRLLVPPGSLLLDLPEMRACLRPFGPSDEAGLTHAWTHPDPRVDELQARVAALVEDAAAASEEPAVTFARVHALAAAACGVEERTARKLPIGPPPPRLTERWFCCAQPTRAQLEGI